MPYISKQDVKALFNQSNIHAAPLTEGTLAVQTRTNTTFYNCCYYCLMQERNPFGQIAHHVTCNFKWEIVHSKAMRGQSPQFAGLQSYFLKMCLIEVMGQHTDDNDWTTDKTGLIDVLNCIHNCLEAGIIPCHFKDPVFLKLHEDARNNLRNLIWGLITKEKKMNDFLEKN